MPSQSLYDQPAVPMRMAPIGGRVAQGVPRTALGYGLLAFGQKLKAKSQKPHQRFWQSVEGDDYPVSSFGIGLGAGEAGSYRECLRGGNVGQIAKAGAEIRRIDIVESKAGTDVGASQQGVGIHAVVLGHLAGVVP